MPKRSAEEKIKYYSAKIKKLQSRKRICSSRGRRIVPLSSDSDDSVGNGAQTYNGDTPPASTPLSPLAAPAPEPAPPPEPARAEPPAAPAPNPPDEQAPRDHVHDEVMLSASNSNALIIAELDPELLLALGDAVIEAPAYGPDIHSTLAQRWIPILKKGLQREPKEQLMKLYSCPDNCRLLKAPLLNAEISAAVADITRIRDRKMQTKQDQLGLGITAVSRAMTLLLTGDDKIQAIRTLTDGCRILTDLHHMETLVRKKLIYPGLDKSLLSIINDQDRDDTVFGNNLSEKIRASKAIEKQALQIKNLQQKPSVSTTSASSNITRPGQGDWHGSLGYPASSRGGALQRSGHRH